MSAIPISRTKIILPRRRTELLSRKRLLDILFESLDKKLILVSAPAGYGKTSTLIDFATQSELPCCWLALDELDREPQRFIAYFIAALAERFPEFGGQSASILGGLTSLGQNDMERVLVTLVNETYEQIHEHFILVLDDFHLVDNIQPIQNFLNRFIQLVDENCHVVIASRILTSLPDLPLMVAREQVSGLSFSDLAFHADEIQALLAQNNNLRVSDAEAQKMIEKTEGWITGLQFSISSGDLSRSIPNTGVGLFDFLGQQVLERQSPAMQDFLLRTSIMEEFDVSICEMVLSPLYPEPQNWQGWISALVQNNLFVLPVGADGRWVRYHHLFRDFLRAHFEQLHPEEVKPILSRLGRAYEDLGEWEKAHHIYKKLNDNEVLTQMIERAGFSMLQRALLTVESWLNDLPPSFLRTRPELLSIRGTIAYMKGNSREGLNLLNQAEHIFRESGNIPGLILTLVRRATAYRFIGDYVASVKDADEVIQVTATSDDLQMLYAEALRVKGLSLFRMGHARQSVEALEKSFDLFVRMNHEPSMPVLLMETGMVYQAIGNYTEAGNMYEKALQIWRKEGNLSWQANLLNNLGILRQFQGEYEKAAQAFEEGLICAQRSAYTRMEALIFIAMGDLSAEMEDFRVAQLNYQHAKELVSEMNDRFLLYYLGMAQAILALLQNKPQEASQLIIDAAGLIRSGDSLYEQGLLNFVRGRLLLVEGNPSQAIVKLEEAGKCFSEDGRMMESDANRIWLAAAYHQLKNNSAARLLTKNIPGGWGQVSHEILVAVHQARNWLEGLQRDAEVGSMVGDLLTRASRMAGKMPETRRHLHRMAHVVQIPNPHLIIRAFGKATISVGGKLLTLSDWQTQSVRDLFFFFLTSQKPLTREQVGQALWPDIDEPPKIKLRFKNDIYRLRRAVGQDVITYEDVLYKFNRALDFEYDVEAFESFLARAKSTKDVGEQITLYQKAVDLVTGRFLDEIYADWAMIERERLSQVFLTALHTLAELLQKQAQPEQALAACQRALDYEPTFEAAYSLSMQVYHRMGDRASVIRTYQLCRETLHRQIGLMPSKETEQLYRRLIT
jgi:ATP/maltotriose-dependent transcriptional regulator MalT/DNA-binding SARP family transcriptional activator